MSLHKQLSAMPKQTTSQASAICAGTDSADDGSTWLYWETISKEILADCKIFSVNKVLANSSGSAKKSSNFFTLNCGSWVNIIPLTEQRDVIMVEQYRHGIEELTLEIPGGCVDISDTDAGAAAMRELKEETGYEAQHFSFLGKNHPNPALQDNLCYTYLAEGVRQVEAPQFDNSGTEKINTRIVKLSDIGNLIREGVISHALVITAFHFLMLQRPELLE